MSETINLKKQTAYLVISSTDEYHTKETGMYRTAEDASLKSIKSGWYNSDGEVVAKDVWVDEKNNVYELKALGNFNEVTMPERLTIIEAIKEKLSVAEQNVLKLWLRLE